VRSVVHSVHLLWLFFYPRSLVLGAPSPCRDFANLREHAMQCAADGTAQHVERGSPAMGRCSRKRAVT